MVTVPGTRAGGGRREIAAEQQPGGVGEEQRPVIQGQAQQRGEHGADRQRAGPPGPPGQRGLDDRGLAGAVDELGGEGHRLVADAAGGRQGQAGAAHRVRSCAPAGPQGALGGADARDVAGVAGQRPGLGDPGDGQQHRDRGARGQVTADEGRPGPAQRQPRRGRVSGQAPGEVGDEVLVAAVGRAGAEHEPAARAAGQLPGAAGVARGDRHHPRGRPADMNHHLAAVPGDVTAAQRHQLAGPQPRADAEYHQRQRRGAFRRVALGGGEGCQLRPLGRRVRRRRPRARERRRPLPRRPVPRLGEPVQRRPVRAPGRRCPARQARHAERLDHVIIQQELPAGRDPARISEPGQPAQRGGGHAACRQHAQARRVFPASPGHA